MIRRLTCPVCEKELPLEIDSESPLFPFCCSRCKQVDLHRWLSGGYAIVENLTPDKLFEHLAEQNPEQDV
ncbi:DNA gyrase inhibitor YacG [Planctomicrobium sp. SH661]|uniref:DNA gyrase inhibitor YacG n=1 Tax=Planctomicrobium sp. SH661 TaxID=3448124 RepID=UPI003F5BE75D